MGLTTGGSIGADDRATLDDCVARSTPARPRRTAVHADVIVLCHGGPIAEPEDAATCSRTARAATASTARRLERLPTERALTEQTRRFTGLRIHATRRALTDQRPFNLPTTLETP